MSGVGPRVALVVGVLGLVGLVVFWAVEQARPLTPVDGKMLAASVRDEVGAVRAWPSQCRRGQDSAWACTTGDHEGSGGVSYRVVLRDRCWRATLTADGSERRDMPRTARGCVG